MSDFTNEKTTKNEKTFAPLVWEWLNGEDGGLYPLKVISTYPEPSLYSQHPFGTKYADGNIVMGIERDESTYMFAVEIKTQNTPQIIHNAIQLLLSNFDSDLASERGERHPLLIVPYLAPARIEELEQAGVSGIDLCGNGIITVRNRLHIVRTGKPNLYPAKRSIANPYAGKSSLVARALLMKGMHGNWNSLSELVQSIKAHGGDISLPAASKAISAYFSELIANKDGKKISLIHAGLLLNKLLSYYKPPKINQSKKIKISDDANWQVALNELTSDTEFKWVMSGATSSTHYYTMADNTPPKIYVNSLSLASNVLTQDSKRSLFPNLEIIETADSTVFFNAHKHEFNNWSSKIQCLLEMSVGDPRQQQAAGELKNVIIRDVHK